MALIYAALAGLYVFVLLFVWALLETAARSDEGPR